MVSLAKTTTRYRGRMAAGYDAKRRKQLRWKLEENELEVHLDQRSKIDQNILDVPVGTGRFLKLYGLHQLKVTGLDSSEEMVKLARRKVPLDQKANMTMATASILDVEASGKFDHVVCFRFLDLMEESILHKVMRKLAACVRVGGYVVFTIRLGVKYVAKSNTATHNERKFRLLLDNLSLKVVHEEPIFKAGWLVFVTQRSK